VTIEKNCAQLSIFGYQASTAELLLVMQGPEMLTFGGLLECNILCARCPSC